MTPRAKITGVVISYTENGLEIEKTIPLSEPDKSSTSNYTALFWSGDTISHLLAPYYAKNQVEFTDELRSYMAQIGNAPVPGKYIRPEDVQILWNNPLNDGRLPLMIAKEAQSPVKPYYFE